jgi:hypothetical protein
MMASFFMMVPQKVGSHFPGEPEDSGITSLIDAAWCRGSPFWGFASRPALSGSSFVRERTPANDLNCVPKMDDHK